MRFQIYMAISILMVSFPIFTYAGFSEPDYVLYGTVYVNNTPVSTATVTAHKMDESLISEAGFTEGSYVLRIPIDSSVSTLGGREQAVHSGDSVLIKINSEEVDESPIRISGRGDLVPLDLHIGSISIPDVSSTSVRIRVDIPRSQLTIAWDKIEGDTSGNLITAKYRIYRSTNADFEPSEENFLGEVST